MLVLLSFPKKSSFGANGQFRQLEMVLRGRGVYTIGVMVHFTMGIFLLGGGSLTRSVSDNWNFFQS